MAAPASLPTDSDAAGPTSGIPAVGDMFAGRYRVLALLGEGAMGAVFRATDTVLDRTVALKIINEALARDPIIAERMLVEARSVATIASEHVARVLDMGRGPNGAPFLVLEYLDGTDFFDLLAKGGPLPAEDAIDWTLEACEALAEAHAAHVVHRDLKPENLFLARRTDGTRCVKVLDFGISKRVGPRAASRALTLPSEIVGSPHYMAPEQLRLAPVDTRTDVWALGATLYELLSGQRPFEGESFTEICARVLSDEPRPLTELCPGLPHALAVVVETALSKDPAGRYSSIAQLGAALAPFGSERAEKSAARALAVLGEQANPAATRAISGTRRVVEQRDVARVRHAQTTPPVRDAGRSKQAVLLWVGAAATLLGAVLTVSVLDTAPTAEGATPPRAAATSSPAPTAILHVVTVAAPAPTVRPHDPPETFVAVPARSGPEPATGARVPLTEPSRSARGVQRRRGGAKAEPASPGAPPPKPATERELLPGAADFGGRK